MSATVVGLAIWLEPSPSLSLDGTPSPNAAAAPAAALSAVPDTTVTTPKAALAPSNSVLSPVDAFRRATEALKAGERKNGDGGPADAQGRSVSTIRSAASLWESESYSSPPASSSSPR
jgi:hypothetical protein